MVPGQWTFINFDAPFVYDGTSNIVLVMDDNSGSWTNPPHMACRVFDANGNQAIHDYNDGPNYDPSNPSIYDGELLSVKNQVYFGFTQSIDCWRPAHLFSTDVTSNSATLNWTGYQDSYNVRYRAIPSFYEDFEDGMEDWTVIRNGEGSSTTDWQLYNASIFNGGSNHGGDFVAQSQSWVNGYGGYHVDNWIITPQVTLDGTLRFWVRCAENEYQDHYDVYVSTGTGIDINEFTLLYAPGDPTETWTEVSIDLSSYAGHLGYIAIRHLDYDKERLWIDDFGIYPGEETGEWTTSNAIIGNTFVLNGLTPTTSYEWQVQGNNTSCNGGVTDWSETATFTTTCEAFLVDADNPFFEDFEGASFAPDCWETFSTGSYQWTSSTSYSHSSSHSAYSYYYGDNYLVLPDLELSANASSAQLTFWSYNDFISYFVAGNNKVVLLNGDDETVLWSAETARAEWVETTVDLTPYLGQTITLAFKYAGNDGNDWYVDDVEVSASAPITKPITGYTQGGGWYLIASPVADAVMPTEANGFLTEEFDLYRFNPTNEGNEWENYKAESFNLVNGQGYLYANANNTTLTFIGTPHNGNGEVALVYDANDSQKCWNLVGNPFDCNATLDRQYYVLSADGTGINPVAIPATTPIPPCTAVFVKAVSVGDKAVFSKVTQ